MTLALEATGITKQFPAVLANDHVDFDLIKGEIHALLGENGAGKTTLMNILYGLYQPDSGEIKINGLLTSLLSPRDAISHGIGMVHQHFMLVPPLTVTENIMLGQESNLKKTEFLGPLAVLDRRKVTAEIKALSQEYSLMVDPEARISDLTVGAQQRVEIIKALYRHADILILDEPTSVLTPQEADELFIIMRTLTKQGKSIIFITHKLREVLAVADRISVMRAGKKIGTVIPQNTNQEILAEMMVGRKVILSISKEDSKPGKTILEVQDLKALDDRKHLCLEGVSLQVREGEILGIAGVQGNGQTELTEALTGLRHPISGHIIIQGEETTYSSPRQVNETQTSSIPEDRQKHGLVINFPVRDNFVLNTYYKPPFSHGIEMDSTAIESQAETLISTFDIRTPGIGVLASTLSGGNQQKIIVARELSRPVKLLIASQPTRGLDVGSIEFIHHRIVEARDNGAAVLLISAELDEIMSLSDRVAVMYKGRILDTLDAREATRDKLGLLMAGITTKENANV
jgi:general nucleoside transport system ATP-binding protein